MTIVPPLNGFRPATECIAPRLIVWPAAWKMLQAYVQGVDTEINGFGLVHRSDHNTFTLKSQEDVFITDQTVTGVEANVSGDAYSKALYQAMMQDRDDDLKLQWHSHVNGSAYCSSTDMNTIESFGHTGADWFISVVMNKYGDVFARFDAFQPFRLGCPMTVIQASDASNEFDALANSMIDAHVKVAPNKTRKPVTTR
jgi:hypothetical protein